MVILIIVILAKMILILIIRAEVNNDSDDIECNTAIYKSFVQALLLMSIFHDGLSFMVIGQNPMYVNLLALAAGFSYGVLCCKPPPPLCGVQRQCPCNPRFSNNLSNHHSVT